MGGRTRRGARQRSVIAPGAAQRAAQRRGAVGTPLMARTVTWHSQGAAAIRKRDGTREELRRPRRQGLLQLPSHRERELSSGYRAGRAAKPEPKLSRGKCSAALAAVPPPGRRGTPARPATDCRRAPAACPSIQVHGAFRCGIQSGRAAHLRSRKWHKQAALGLVVVGVSVDV